MNPYLIGFVAVVLIFGAIKAAMDKAKALREAEREYRMALDCLGEDSQNNRLRQSALEKGRHFAQLAREKAGSNGVAIFDEVALTNDLTARLGTNSESAGTVPCPECAEQIQPAAKRCRFCGAELVLRTTAA